MSGQVYFKKILLFVNLIFTFHFALVSYINSSFLEQYIDVRYIGFLYVIASVLAIIFLSQAEKLLVRYGNRKVTLWLVAFDALALFVLVLSKYQGFYISNLIPYSFFIIHYCAGVLILKFTFDVFFEEYSQDEKTGIIRGGLLTAANLAWLMSPLIFGSILTDSQYWKVYAVSLIFTIILFCVVYYSFRKQKEPIYRKVYFLEAIKTIYRRKNLRRILISNFLMHFFFSWMVIYMPIHLYINIGFSWEQIGLLFTLMLIPYVVFDMPLGYLADRVMGEKELLIAGFVIIFISTLPISFIKTNSFLIWAIILMGTRTGSSALEMMTNTYFFKKVKADEGHLISLFRNAQPLSYIAGPLFGSILLSLGLYNGNLFIILAFIMLTGLFFVIPLKDTK